MATLDELEIEARVLGAIRDEISQERLFRLYMYYLSQGYIAQESMKLALHAANVFDDREDNRDNR